MLTEEQILKIRKEIGMPEQGFQGQKSPTENIARRRLLASEYDKQEQPDSGFVGGVKKSFSRGLERAGKAQRRELSGEQGFASSSLQKIGASAGIIGDVFFEGIKAITPEPVKDIARAGAEKIVEQPKISQVLQGLNEWSKQHPEAAANLESMLDIAGVVPITKGGQLLGKGIKQAGESVIKTTGEKISELELRKGLGTVIETTGKKIQSSAPIFRPNIIEAGRIQAEKASRSMMENAKRFLKGQEDQIRKMADTAVDFNLAGLTEGQIGVQSKRAMKNLWKNDIEPALNGIKKQITPNELFSKMEKQLASISDITRKNQLLKALNAMKEDYKGIKNWNYKQLNDLKSEFYNKIPNKAFKGEEIAGALNQVRYLMATEIRKTILEEIPDKMVKYLDYGNLKTIAERGKNALTQPWMSGGSGKVIGQILKTTVTPLQTIGGNTLKWIGTIIKGK